MAQWKKNGLQDTGVREKGAGGNIRSIGITKGQQASSRDLHRGINRYYQPAETRTSYCAVYLDWMRPGRYFLAALCWSLRDCWLLCSASMKTLPARELRRGAREFVYRSIRSEGIFLSMEIDFLRRVIFWCFLTLADLAICVQSERFSLWKLDSIAWEYFEKYAFDATFFWKLIFLQ